jgi:predicted transcriptional regulator
MAAFAGIDARRLPGGTAMSTMTLRLPEDVANRLKNVAESRGVSVNKLITEISVQALSAYDTETRFKVMAAEANIPAALAVLDRLDKQAAQG